MDSLFTRPSLATDADISCYSRESGFNFTYKMDTYEASLNVKDNTCDEVIDAFARFLLGCGFAPQNVVDNLAEVSETLREAWFPDSVNPSDD